MWKFICFFCYINSVPCELNHGTYPRYVLMKTKNLLSSLLFSVLELRFSFLPVICLLLIAYMTADIFIPSILLFFSSVWPHTIFPIPSFSFHLFSSYFPVIFIFPCFFIFIGPDDDDNIDTKTMLSALKVKIYSFISSFLRLAVVWNPFYSDVIFFQKF